MPRAGLIWSAALFRRFALCIQHRVKKAAEKRRTPNQTIRIARFAGARLCPAAFAQYPIGVHGPPQLVAGQFFYFLGAIPLFFAQPMR
jgi:hypothetical protein